MPPAKRKRITRACEPCRKRKSKCDGEQPCCLMCQAAGRRCVYPSSTKRRGLQSGYVRGVETLLGLIMQHYPETESQVEKLLRTSEARQSLSGGDEGEKYAQCWRSSAISRKVNAFIQNSSDIDLESDQEILDLIVPGQSSELNPCDINATPGPADGGNNYTPIQLMSNLEQQLPTSVEINSAEKYPDLLEQPFPPNSTELVDEYFAFTHSWFPIIERMNVLRIMHKQTVPAENDRRMTDIGHRMSLWAIIAYTLTTQSHKPEIPDSLQPQYLETNIRARIILDDEEFSLGHIQAILILVLLRLKLGHLHAAWILVAQAVRMVVVVGHRSKSGRYKQVFYGCAILDNFISTLLNQSSCLLEQEQDLGVIDSDEDEEGVEEWDSWIIPSQATEDLLDKPVFKGPLRALSTFRRVYYLMCRLTKTRDHQSAEQHTFSSIAEYSKFWQSNLPSHCKWSESSETPRPPLLILHLSLHFVLSNSLLGRRSTDTSLVYLCKSTAKSTLDLIEKFIQLTGTSRTSPMLIGFAVQARKLLDFSQPEHTDESISQMKLQLDDILAKLSLGHHLGKDRGTYWTSLTSQMGQVKDKTNAQHRRSRENQQHDHGIFAALDMTEAENSLSHSSLFVEQEQQIPINPLVLDTGENSTITETVAFDDLCEQMIATHQIERNSKDPLFARNLGFLDDSLDDDMLTFLQNPNTRSDYAM